MHQRLGLFVCECFCFRFFHHQYLNYPIVSTRMILGELGLLVSGRLLYASAISY